jgi:phytanoyl-CoA hydroxylase
LAHHPKLAAVLRDLLGDEPVIFQDMALLKPPRLGREKPWHQDLSYFNYDPNSKVVGVWIALDEATVENGCMQLLPGRHREGPITHFKRRDWQICDTDILGKTSVAAPLQPGGLLLFDGLLPHGTPRNGSGRHRRALQFHYTGAKCEKIAATERMRVFGSEGRNVSC